MTNLRILFGGILFICLLLSCSAAAAPFAYIANYDNHSISVIDTTSDTVVHTISSDVASGPYGVAVSPDGSTVYVADSPSTSVSVISTGLNQVVATITGVPNPTGIVVSPDNSTVYVTDLATPDVTVINTSKEQVVATIHIGSDAHPCGITVSPDNSTVYVADNSINKVTVIDTSTETITGTISVGSGPQGIVVSPDGSTIYVVNGGSNNVSVINTATHSLITNVTVGSSPMGMAVTPDGSKVYVSNNGGNTVSVINTSDNTVAATVTVGTHPWGVAVTPDGLKVYVVNQGSNSVSVITTATNAVTTPVTGLNNPKSFGPFIMSSATRTTAPVITTPVYAGSTSVSGTATAGARVVLTYNGVRQAAVTATGGTWTVTVLALTTTDTLSSTAWVSPNRMSAPVTATVVPTTPVTGISAISGTPQVGQTLTAGTVTPPAATVTYQWNKSASINGPYSPILGATSATYAPVAGDVGNYLKVNVTGTGSYAGSVNSTPVGPVIAAPTPTSSGGHGHQSTSQGSSGTNDLGYTGPEPTAMGYNPAPVQPAGTPAVVQQSQQVAGSSPVVVQQTVAAPPAASTGPLGGIPVVPAIAALAGIGVIGGGGFFIRRWWIQRQNPTLFKK
jgi:YVTN family beta-propeller protein